jgi:hypothetical protein
MCPWKEDQIVPTLWDILEKFRESHLRLPGNRLADRYSRGISQITKAVPTLDCVRSCFKRV